MCTHGRLFVFSAVIKYQHESPPPRRPVAGSRPPRASVFNFLIGCPARKGSGRSGFFFVFTSSNNRYFREPKKKNENENNKISIGARAAAAAA